MVVKIVLLDQYSFIISPETGLVYLLNLLEQNNSIVVFFEHQTQVVMGRNIRAAIFQL